MGQDAEQDPGMSMLDNLPYGAPIVSQRCLAGEAPVFPWASAQELNRTCCLADAKARAETQEKPPEPEGKYAKEAREASKEKAEAPKPKEGGKYGRASVDATADEDVCLNEEQRRFGQDAIVSWATGVLTQNILLAKDDRGVYFKWLARIVLRTGTDGEAGKSRSSTMQSESEVTSHRSRSSTMQSETRKSRASVLQTGVLAVRKKS